MENIKSCSFLNPGMELLVLEGFFWHYLFLSELRMVYHWSKKLMLIIFVFNFMYFFVLTEITDLEILSRNFKANRVTSFYPGAYCF
jgi:hypothetical protein